MRWKEKGRKEKVCVTPAYINVSKREKGHSIAVYREENYNDFDNYLVDVPFVFHYDANSNSPYMLKIGDNKFLNKKKDIKNSTIECSLKEGTILASIDTLYLC